MTFSIYTPILRPRQIKDKVIKENIDWKNGLVIRSSNWLGDCLISLPAIYKFYQLLPKECQISIVCRKSVADFWQTIPWISKVIILSGKHASSTDRRKIRSLNAGVAIIIPNSFSSSFDLWRCGIPIRLGRAGRGRKLILTHTIPSLIKKKTMEAATYHQAAHYLDLPAALGWLGWDTHYEPINLPHSIKICTELGMTQEQGPWLVVAPGAAYGPAKQWPAISFAKVANQWIQQGGSVLITGTSKDIPFGEIILSEVSDKNKVLNLIGKTNLKQLMAVIDQAQKLLVNDSGAMHLAAALGKSGVAIFGSTDQIATGPLGGKWILLNHHIKCSPCFKRECPNKKDAYLCLTDIQPQEAIEALNSL